ncbi:MAG: thio(seleno)oxazole modification radical SAM maturase SbtM, partial [Desulfurivibrionaceae bacterium]
MTLQEGLLEKYYPVCLSLAGRDKWKILLDCSGNSSAEDLPRIIARKTEKLDLPPYLSDLASLEYTYREALESEVDIPDKVDQIIINPSLHLMDLQWRNLVPLLFAKSGDNPPLPEKCGQYIIIWKDPDDQRVRVRECLPEELLALKMLVEDIDRKEAAAMGDLPVGRLDSAFDRAIASGIILSPSSRIRRDETMFPIPEDTKDQFLSAKVFTLQWHLTQACDLHCKHCYDRSRRSPLTLDQGLDILDQMRDFIRDRHVRGQISFTGGNPLLYPHFLELYQGAAERGFNIAVLGNPTTAEMLEEINGIRRPLFFQVSLEGLQEHNDSIRGEGHFDRIVDFLGLLREKDISSIVMLTLTRANIDQVIPLCEFLKNKVDKFTFNRLSLVGEGANLQLPSPERFQGFLKEYLEAAADNPVMGLKDNLLNIARREQGKSLFGGCAGYGCGAAFNFLCALPDGEVHACRKFPSPVGNIYQQSLTEIYDSDESARYRSGSKACKDCRI